MLIPKFDHEVRHLMIAQGAAFGNIVEGVLRLAALVGSRRNLPALGIELGRRESS
jgi:hypothetical protein